MVRKITLNRGGGGFGMYPARMPLTTVVVYFSKFEFTLTTQCTKCMLWVVSRRKTFVHLVHNVQSVVIGWW